MEILRKQISLEESTNRSSTDPKIWGTMTAETFYINIFLTQSMDNMGIFTDIEFIPETAIKSTPNYDILIEKLNGYAHLYPTLTGGSPTFTGYSNYDNKTLRKPNKHEDFYYNYLKSRISGYTDSKLEELRTYDAKDPYRIGFDVEQENYINYEAIPVSGKSRIISVNPRKYVFDGELDNNGVVKPDIGIHYTDYTGTTREVMVEGQRKQIPVSIINYIGEGFNQTNIGLSGTTKEEYLFGIIFPPEVKSDVFIDRGITSVMDVHLKLSEVNNLNQLARYGNGFYTLNKQ